MSGRIEGKIALVTGAARGLGAMEAKLFAQEGAAAIIMADVNQQELQLTADEVRNAGNAQVITVQLDVTSEEDWLQVTEGISSQFEKLDILVNNAGINKRLTFEQCSLEEWNRIITVNQTGVFLGIKYCAPLLKRSGKGSIINKSSITGMTGYYAVPYTASKWAVRGLTKSAAMEFGAWGIRVNSVNPGFIWTPLNESIKDMVLAFNELNALERAGNPEEVAKAVLYLASDESSYMTGTELVVDGGLTAGGQMRSVAKQFGIY